MAENIQITYVLIPGAYHDPSIFDKLKPLLEEDGNKVIAPDIPTNIQGMTFEDDAEAISENLDSGYSYIVSHSRGVNVLPWLLQKGTDRVRHIGATVFSTCGPKLLLGRENIYKRNHIKPHKNTEGLWEYTPSEVNAQFYNQTRAEDLDLAMSALRPQRTIEADTFKMPPPLPYSFPIQAIEGIDDKIHRWSKVQSSLLEWAGVTPTRIEGDHTLQLSNKERLSELIKEHAGVCIAPFL